MGKVSEIQEMMNIAQEIITSLRKQWSAIPHSEEYYTNMVHAMGKDMLGNTLFKEKWAEVLEFIDVMSQKPSERDYRYQWYRDLEKECELREIK